MNFLERCRQECTKNVIFLFQRRIWNVIGAPDGYEFDDEGHCVPEGNWNGDVISPAELSKMISGDFDVPCAIEHWDTEKVFLTREEGESYGKSRDYDYKDGWRVYAVPSSGKLAELLKGT